MAIKILSDEMRWFSARCRAAGVMVSLVSLCGAALGACEEQATANDPGVFGAGEEEQAAANDPDAFGAWESGGDGGAAPYPEAVQKTASNQCSAPNMKKFTKLRFLRSKTKGDTMDCLQWTVRKKNQVSNTALSYEYGIKFRTNCKNNSRQDLWMMKRRTSDLTWQIYTPFTGHHGRKLCLMRRHDCGLTQGFHICAHVVLSPCDDNNKKQAWRFDKGTLGGVNNPHGVYFDKPNGEYSFPSIYFLAAPYSDERRRGCTYKSNNVLIHRNCSVSNTTAAKYQVAVVELKNTYGEWSWAKMKQTYSLDNNNNNNNTCPFDFCGWTGDN